MSDRRDVLLHPPAWRRTLACAALGLLLGAGAPATASSVFATEEADGSLLLSDDAAGAASRIVVAADAAQPHRRPAPDTRAVREGIDEIVRGAAQRHAVDAALLHAVIAVESGYRPLALSPRGAGGLMQLMPATAARYGVTDRFDPRQNVDAGARHLRHLLDAFGQDRRLALAAYNAGAAAVLAHGRRVPPYPETMAYVPRVLQRWAALREVGRAASDAGL